MQRERAGEQEELAACVAELRALVLQLEMQLVERDAKLAKLPSETGRERAKFEQATVERWTSRGRARKTTQEDVRRRKKTKPSPRKRGGQTQHKGSHRKLWELERLDETIEVVPLACEHCGCEQLHTLETKEGVPRHQVFDLYEKACEQSRTV